MSEWWKSVLTIVGSGGLLTWYLTSRSRQVTTRRSHTFDALLRISLDPLYQQNLTAVRPYIHKPGNDSFPDLQHKRNKNLKDSIIFLLNYYEFIAVGFWSGVLSESLLLNDQGTILPNLFRHAEEMIIYERKSKDNPKLFNELEDLYLRWKDREPPFYQRFFEWILLRPIRSWPLW
jgi:hypothetical protein